MQRERSAALRHATGWQQMCEQNWRNDAVKGRTPTKTEKQFHDRLCRLGCIACRKDGRINLLVSVHHIDGRTKPDAHMKVLPLCAGHHQHNTGAPGLTAVHPYKARFEHMYGRQEQLLAECIELLSDETTT